MHQEYPDSFDVPTKEDLRSITVNDYVKISNGQERFWIQICEKCTRGYLRGIVMNRLIFHTNYTIGDIIQIHERHVYDILRERPSHSL